MAPQVVRAELVRSREGPSACYASCSRCRRSSWPQRCVRCDAISAIVILPFNVLVACSRGICHSIGFQRTYDFRLLTF